jgi:hypothetical protein
MKFVRLVVSVFVWIVLVCGFFAHQNSIASGTTNAWNESISKFNLWFGWLLLSACVYFSIRKNAEDEL